MEQYCRHEQSSSDGAGSHRQRDSFEPLQKRGHGAHERVAGGKVEVSGKTSTV
jgi:hypothetical protein